MTTGARRATRNPLALAVLAYLAERPMHPYELGKLLKERNQQESIKYKHSSLYMVIEQLARAGHVTEHETRRDTGRPERTLYALTADGRDELHRWMREAVAAPVKEYRQFEAALALIVVLPPADVLDLLEQRHRALSEQADRIRSTVAAALGEDTDPLFLIEDEYRLALIDAETAFIQRFRRRITRNEPTFGRFWREFHADRPGQR